MFPVLPGHRLGPRTLLIPTLGEGLWSIATDNAGIGFRTVQQSSGTR